MRPKEGLRVKSGAQLVATKTGGAASRNSNEDVECGPKSLTNCGCTWPGYGYDR